VLSIYTLSAGGLIYCTEDDIQSPSSSSRFRRLVNSDSMNEPPKSSLCDLISPLESFASVERSNRVSRPDIVGKKNGAFSGALGGSLGLFRCYLHEVSTLQEPVKRGVTLIVSRFSKVCHLDRGIKERVSRPSDNCAGVV